MPSHEDSTTWILEQRFYMSWSSECGSEVVSTSATVLSTFSQGVPGTSWDPVAFSDLEVSSLKSMFPGMPVHRRPTPGAGKYLLQQQPPLQEDVSHGRRCK